MDYYSTAFKTNLTNYVKTFSTCDLEEVLLFRQRYRLFFLRSIYENLHEFFCHFISWTNWVNSSKFIYIRRVKAGTHKIEVKEFKQKFTNYKKSFSYMRQTKSRQFFSRTMRFEHAVKNCPDIFWENIVTFPSFLCYYFWFSIEEPQILNFANLFFTKFSICFYLVHQFF